MIKAEDLMEELVEVLARTGDRLRRESQMAMADAIESYKVNEYTELMARSKAFTDALYILTEEMRSLNAEARSYDNRED